MDIPAVVGARAASQLIRQDQLGHHRWQCGRGLLVDPSPIILDEYRFRQRQDVLERDAPGAPAPCALASTLDGQKVRAAGQHRAARRCRAAVRAGAVGVGLFRSEFLFMGANGHLPDEEEQYRAYSEAVEGMQGLPVADPHHRRGGRQAAGQGPAATST